MQSNNYGAYAGLFRNHGFSLPLTAGIRVPVPMDGFMPARLAAYRPPYAIAIQHKGIYMLSFSLAAACAAGPDAGIFTLTALKNGQAIAGSIRSAAMALAGEKLFCGQLLHELLPGDTLELALSASSDSHALISGGVHLLVHTL